MKCDYPERNYINGDLIKCNVCCKWVCKECSDIAVAKLKPIMHKCKSLYFICKACNEMNEEDAVFEEVIAAGKKEAQIQLADNSDMVKTLESMFDKKDHANGILTRKNY